LCTGLFTPGQSSLERERKVDLGLTALLTLAVVLLMLNDMIPNTQYSAFPWLGRRVVVNAVNGDHKIQDAGLRWKLRSFVLLH
jgi:hypothetical protein